MLRAWCDSYHCKQEVGGLSVVESTDNSVDYLGYCHTGYLLQTRKDKYIHGGKGVTKTYQQEIEGS
jgi:hypothetical protein